MSDENEKELISGTNDSMVANFIGSGMIRVALPRSMMTREQAINLAGWLIGASYATEDEINPVIENAQQTFMPQEQLLEMKVTPIGSPGGGRRR